MAVLERVAERLLRSSFVDLVTGTEHGSREFITVRTRIQGIHLPEAENQSEKLE